MLAAFLIWKEVEGESLQTRISIHPSPAAQGNTADSFVTSSLGDLLCSDGGASRKLDYFCQREKQQPPPHPGSSPRQHQIFAPAVCRVGKLDMPDGAGSFPVYCEPLNVQDAFHRMGSSCCSRGTSGRPRFERRRVRRLLRPES